jgi:prepilin-type processing-associated H-X9-DG protein
MNRIGRRQGWIAAASIICAALFSFAWQANANTLIIILSDKNVTVIGADSQVSTPQGTPFGNVCKIHVTDNHVWATAGMMREVGAPFDVWVEAEAAIRAGGSSHEIATRFERAVTPELQELLPRLRAARPDDYARALRHSNAVNSVFLDGVTVETMDFTVPDLNAPQIIQVIRHSCPGNCPVIGIIQLVIGDHDATDAELLRSPGFWESRGVVGGMNYLMELQHQATPLSVAGTLSILSIDKSGATQWLQKGICN